MNTLVLVSRQDSLDAVLFNDQNTESIWSNTLYTRRAGMKNIAESQSILDEIRVRMDTGPISLIAIRITYGGALFQSPALFDEEAEAKMESLIPEAPFHLPGQLNLARACRAIFPESQIVLVCETAFFLSLPMREQLYALDTKRAGLAGLRRYGFHGIYHAGASAWAARHRPRHDRTPRRVLSICLEPKPEVAAIRGHRPVIVTSGATPLEGIPGETSCGEIDPDIVIMLAKKRGWGPEKIDAILSQKSGISGFLGQDTKLPDIFNEIDEANTPGASTREDYARAREILSYYLLRAAGSSIAALNGLDTIVFTGRYGNLGTTLGPYLAEKLQATLPGRTTPMPWLIAPLTLERLIANQAGITCARASPAWCG